MARRVPKRLPALLIALVLLIGGISVGPSAAQAECHPIQTTPVFAGVVPTAARGPRLPAGPHAAAG